MDEYGPLLQKYGIRMCYCDGYAANSLAAFLQPYRIGVEKVPAYDTATAVYLNLREVLRNKGLALPRSERLIEQLCELVRTETATGRDLIRHKEHRNDDLALSVGSSGQRGLSK